MCSKFFYFARPSELVKVVVGIFELLLQESKVLHNCSTIFDVAATHALALSFSLQCFQFLNDSILLYRDWFDDCVQHRIAFLGIDSNLLAILGQYTQIFLNRVIIAESYVD